VSQPASVTRAELEDFLYHEAALLDEWRLKEWLELFTDDATYSIPPTDAPDADPDDTLFLVADDAERLRSRVEQLMGKTSWSESPHSRTRRLIGNVRIRRTEGSLVFATANFVVHRLRMNQHATYVGRYEYTLETRGERLRIRDRRAILDLESLRDVGKVSFIL